MNATDVIDTAENVSDISKKAGGSISSNISMAQIQDLSQETLDGLYAYAYDFYEKGRLDDAEVFFKFLCIYDFFNADYLKGYAAVCQLKKEYQRACDLYGISFSVSKNNDYSCVYLMGQCLLCMKKFDPATECFKTVIENATDADLISKAGKYIQLLSDLINEFTQGEEN